MKNRILTLLLLSAIAFGCGSSQIIEETVILHSKEPVGDSYKLKKLYKKPSDIEGIDSIVGSKTNPFRNGAKEPPIERRLKNDSVYKP